MIIDTDEIYKTLIPQDLRLPGYPVKYVSVDDCRALTFAAWYQMHPALCMTEVFRETHKTSTHEFFGFSGYVNRMECTVQSSEIALVEFTITLFTEKDAS